MALVHQCNGREYDARTMPVCASCTDMASFPTSFLPDLLFLPIPQVLLHAPARTHGKWIPALGAYVIEPAQLPFFVDSDWSLDFGVPAVPLDTQQGGGGDSSGIPRAGAQSCGAGGGVCFGDLNDQQHAGQGGEGVQQQEFRSSACGAGSGVGGREGAGECPADGSHAHATRRIDA
eukprot:scaffold135671_cov20-Tisochrysis_lutea.AAC.1